MILPSVPLIQNLKTKYHCWIHYFCSLSWEIKLLEGFVCLWVLTLFVISQVDDEQDMEIVNQLIDPHPPEGFFVTSTEGLPGLEELEVVRNLQMFTQIWRSRIPSNQPSSSIHKQFHKLLQVIYTKQTIKLTFFEMQVNKITVCQLEKLVQTFHL